MAEASTSITTVPCPKCGHPGALAASFLFTAANAKGRVLGKAYMRVWCPSCGDSQVKGAAPTSGASSAIQSQERRG